MLKLNPQDKNIYHPLTLGNSFWTGFGLFGDICERNLSGHRSGQEENLAEAVCKGKTAKHLPKRQIPSKRTKQKALILFANHRSK